MLLDGVRAGLAAVTLSLAVWGCYGTTGRNMATDAEPSEKIRVEAYSFDARLHRDGKPTSFKLRVFQTDTVLALSGTGYLGKGALKGRLTTDSLEVYFPASNEYLYEALADILTSSDCPVSPTGLDLLVLFRSLPDSLEPAEELRVTADYHNAGRPVFVVHSPGCNWRIELVYDRQKTGWRLREFDFDDGDRVRFHAERAKYKAEAKIKRSLFNVPRLADAKRISL